MTTAAYRRTSGKYITLDEAHDVAQYVSRHRVARVADRRRRRRYERQGYKVCMYMLAGMSVTQAAEEAGVCRVTATRVARSLRPEVARRGLKVRPCECGREAWHRATCRGAEVPWLETRGEEHHSARLTEDDVREIRRRREAGETLSSIAEDYPVSLQSIHKIAARKTWAHV